MIKDLYDYLAKPDKTIGEHVEDLIFRANILRKLGYIKDIHIYNLLIQACKGHDLGKANKEFLKRILNPKLHFDETKEISHNILSVYYLDKNEFDENTDDYLIVACCILFHHDYCNEPLVIKTRTSQINSLLIPEYNQKPSRRMLKNICNNYLKKNLEKKRVRELLSPNPTLANELVFSPMEDWTDDDVWSFLLQYKNPWNYSNMDLMTMYRGATADNECPLQIDKSTPTCGKSRFGCWVCTMVEKDKSMEAMIFNDQEKEWMSTLLQFRNEFGNEDGDRERRSFRRMKGNLQGNYGKLFHGPYKKEVREYWLERLLNIQKEIQENGPEEFSNLELIRIPELQAIRRIWVNDKHEFDDSLPKIYEKVVGKEFEDPEWIHYENFEAEEWNILKEVCEEMFPDEELTFEMMYSLIDIENKASGVNQRKGILDNVNSIIRKTCYKNEKDATEYYTNMMQRKKENGGKYNEKFLDYQPLESEFDEEEE